ncbi:hypothetical protein N0B44_02155 [Roseibacterium beibuensis]|uniref:Uncharacterized protein n=1 Tax=[Roseibacterium] beibuensis TaxID=1193142 RepID=A0ABP9KYQ9_9RHOB|nr:hypothetical protein [Roseibacterium beibuensis]MCS6621706.1 hypothetical protein [Roseibacterium beibuensis]
MTFDIAHALVTGVLILLTIVGMEQAGLYVPHKKGGPRFSWPLFLAIFVVVLIFNLIWP